MTKCAEGGRGQTNKSCTKVKGNITAKRSRFCLLTGNTLLANFFYNLGAFILMSFLPSLVRSVACGGIALSLIWGWHTPLALADYFNCFHNTFANEKGKRMAFVKGAFEGN